jgi:hypothetical protein
MSALQHRSRVLPDQRFILVPYDQREAISIEQAVKRSGQSASTLRTWCEKKGIGRRIGGHWKVSKVALQMFLDGNEEALSAYHRAERTSPIVIAYFERERQRDKKAANEALRTDAKV